MYDISGIKKNREFILKNLINNIKETATVVFNLHVSLFYSYNIDCGRFL